MNVAYLDFNEDDMVEDYSVNPKSYGGGRVFASIAKERFGSFYIFSNPLSFKNLEPNERRNRCGNLASEQRARIRAGEPIKDIIPFAEEFDLFIHHQVNYHINVKGLKAKECCWAVGYGEPCHPENTNLLLYNQYQFPRVSSTTKVHKIVIGKPIPEFQEYKKGDYIFQCTRHCKQFGSIEVAEFAKGYGITAYFAGPINKDYPLLNHIDNERTFYLGLISEDTKIELLKLAKAATFLHQWNTPFSLSAIEALSYGTPIVALPTGFWPSLVNGKNGMLVGTQEELEKFFLKSYNQRDCYESALPYSEEEMLKSFKKVIEDIVIHE